MKHRARSALAPVLFVAGLFFVGPLASIFAQGPVSPTPPTGGAAALAAGPLPRLTPEITRTEIEAHVRFLASDELAGRDTGSPGSERAARYLAAVLRASGIAPAGDDGTYLQDLHLEQGRSLAEPELVVTGKDGRAEKALFGPDFDWAITADRTTAALRVVLARSLEEIPVQPDAGVALFVDAKRSERRAWMVKRGNPAGVGWGLVVEPGREQKGREKGPLTDAWGPLEQDEHAPGGHGKDHWLSVNGELLQRLRKGEIGTLQLTTRVEHRPLHATNVVGILRGVGTSAEPALANEAVVLTAHYDHLGTRPTDAGLDDVDSANAKKDVIFNGADDDASGCSAVLELAGKFGAGPKPARTLLFVLVTGEERGLLGTLYYLDSPAVPLANTVANLNFEMIGRPDELGGGAGKLWLTGYELSNLGPAYAAAKLAILPDPHPKEHFFERSDNIAFVRRGIVGQTFSTYNLHDDYHHVSDEASKLDYAHMESCVRAGFDAVRLVADGSVRPAWLEGKDPNERRGPKSRGAKGDGADGSGKDGK